MSTGDITFYNAGTAMLPGAKKHQVVGAANPPAINPGEMVLKTLGNQYVIKMATNKPVVATDFSAGISIDASTETATLDGSVNVMPITPGVIYLIKPLVAATFFGSATVPSQSTYSALVGKRVLIDVTSGAETLLAADNSTYGCVIENLDVVRYPGLAAFSIRQAVSYTA